MEPEQEKLEMQKLGFQADSNNIYTGIFHKIDWKTSLQIDGLADKNNINAKILVFSNENASSVMLLGWSAQVVLAHKDLFEKYKLDKTLSLDGVNKATAQISADRNEAQAFLKAVPEFKDFGPDDVFYPLPMKINGKDVPVLKELFDIYKKYDGELSPEEIKGAREALTQTAKKLENGDFTKTKSIFSIFSAPKNDEKAFNDYRSETENRLGGDAGVLYVAYLLSLSKTIQTSKNTVTQEAKSMTDVPVKQDEIIKKVAVVLKQVGPVSMADSTTSKAAPISGISLPQPLAK